MSMKWRVIGLDSTTGKGREVVLVAVDEHEAQIAANELGIMVERVEATEDLVDDMNHADSSVDSAARNDSVIKKQRKPKLVATMHGLVDSDKIKDDIRKQREARGSDNPFGSQAFGRRMAWNRIAEIAMGVFLGMLLLSCVSPCLIYGALSFIAEIGKQSPASP